MGGYNPQDFESVITYMRREFGPEAFRNPSRMFAIFCDLSPKLKPYGNIARQLAERGILSGLEAASANGDAQAPTVAQSVSQPRILPMSGRSGVLTWNLDSGVLTISGRGDMEDFTHQAYHQSTAPWGAYQAEIASALIKEGVTSVGQEAFSYCANLQSVMIPVGVTKIGDMAFRGCAALRRVTIPHSVREIGLSAFDGCARLKSVKIPRGAERIKAYAFAECGSLTSVTIPNSVRRIGYRAFRNCAELVKAYVPADVKIDPDAFDFHTVIARY